MNCAAGYPDTPSLAAALSAAFSKSGASGEVAIVKRSPNPYVSSFPSEIIRCMVWDRPVAVFAKYEFEDDEYRDHRRPLKYEVDVHERILSDCPLSTPRYYGSVFGRGGKVWIFSEFVDDAIRVKRAPAPDGLSAAAQWLGDFHRWSAAKLTSPEARFLQSFDSAYYVGWGLRAVRFDENRHDWLPQVAARASEAILDLLVPNPTIIHGEFYPDNVLWRDSKVYPVDWQSAGAGAGEIDLASIVEGWCDETVHVAKEKYRAARWPGGTPLAFEERFAAAQTYWLRRWLGAEGDGTHDPDLIDRFDVLREQGERAGWI